MTAMIKIQKGSRWLCWKMPGECTSVKKNLRDPLISIIVRFKALGHESWRNTECARFDYVLWYLRLLPHITFHHQKKLRPISGCDYHLWHVPLPTWMPPPQFPSSNISFAYSVCSPLRLRQPRQAPYSTTISSISVLALNLMSIIRDQSLF